MLNNKNFFEGINADDAIRILADGDYLNMENMRGSVSGLGLNRQLENIPSSLLVHTHAGTGLGIGRAVDYARIRLILFVWDAGGEHIIYAYDIESETTYTVLKSSQTESGLNFSKNFRISRNARVVGDLLLWTDNNNEPQCINIERGIKLNHPSYQTNVAAYTTPIPYTTRTLIQRPPNYPLQMTKLSDGGFVNNYIQNNAYQFTAYYVSKDYQQSALAPYSPLAGYNAKDEDSNYIQVQLSFSEVIPDYVQQIVFCVKYGNFGKTFTIKTWDKSYYYDLLEIESHNANSIQLTYNFFDNIIGSAVDDITANTAFDGVALKAKTLEVAHNRVFLASVLKGYSAPLYTSLSATLTHVDTGGGGAFAGTWGYITLHANWADGGTCQDTYNYPFVYVPTGLTNNYYYVPSARNSTIWNGGVGTVPTSINLSDTTFGGTDIASLAEYLKITQYPLTAGCIVSAPVWQTPYEASALDALGSVSVVNFTPVNVNRFFKSNSDYEINIEFKDRYNRKCGVVKTGIRVTIPKRSYDQVSFATAIQWSLSNFDAINQIPLWAYYYQIVITKNETTRFFEQIRATGVQYVTKNQDGTYTYGNTWTFGTTYALGIDISAFTNYGLGYTFAEDDYASLILSDNTFLTLRVLGQDGNFVFLSPTDVGTGSASMVVLLELYTPYKTLVTEPYYEVPAVYPVSSPGTVRRTFSTLTDTINGDTYAIERKDSAAQLYIVEAMSPNDKAWFIWQTDAGWINIFDSIGQQLKETSIDWSDTYINGTKVNGFNKFQPLNTKDIGNSSGAIQKLQLTNKMQENGTVMLIIAVEETLSAYLGEIQLYQAAQQADLVTTDDVIGSINALQNSRGTINPESVVEYNGLVFWFDALHGVVAQYSVNGIDDVSAYKEIRFWDRYGKRYIEQGAAAIEALCGFSYIETCVDPSTKELLITLPQVEENTVTSGIPVGFAPALPSYSTLPSYTTSIQNRFDIYDGQPKTRVYNWLQNRWKGSYGFLPDCMESVGNKLYGIKNANLYLFNEETSSYNIIFGVAYPQRICFVTKMPPSAIEEILNIALEANKIPNYTVAYVSYPNEQITDLTAGDYTSLEGVQYARLFKDRLSPNATGTFDEKLYSGDTLRSAVGFVMVEFSEYADKLEFIFGNLGFKISRGHNQIINPKS